MRTQWIWSVSLGRWWNVHLRLHLFFFLFVAFVVYLTSSQFNAPNWLGGSCAMVVLLSVLLHEVGHVVVARRLGGVADEIVLGPLGGLGTYRVPYEPQSELVVIMAGTLVNASVCFLSALLLAVIWPGEVDLVVLLQPTVSYFGATADELSAVAVLKLVFWVNWSLILINLIPVFPFDGGRSLQALLSMVWSDVPPRQTTIAICRLGRVAAALLLLWACIRFAGSAQQVSQPPLWFGLTLISIYIFFNSRREELQQVEVEQEEETVFGYDFSQGYTSLERSLSDDDNIDSDAVDIKVDPPHQGLLGRWLERRRKSHLQRQRKEEAEDEKRVDEVLDRLHKHGMRSLSQADRALLDRVSKRYRSRQS